MQKTFFISGALLAGLAVALGAWGAHGGAKYLDSATAITFEKAVRYQMHHALALLFVAVSYKIWPTQTKLLNWAGFSFLAGIAFFSGSLYLIVFAKLAMGYFTPFGGVLFMIGWLSMAYAAFRSKE
ncbi:MAG TPA: DUF423 domain-containing protein [Bacteroidales bacterium]|nr:DUF423 domain-containing protein [Bacteroidales bacterium]